MGDVGKDVRLKLEKDSLWDRTTRSGVAPGSAREGEVAGEVGRLAGRKKEGFLRTCIMDMFVMDQGMEESQMIGGKMVSCFLILYCCRYLCVK